MIYEYQKRESRRRRNKFKIFKWIFFLFGIIFVSYLGMIALVIILSLFQNKSQKGQVLSDFISPLGTIIEMTKKESKLPEVVLPIIENEDGEYSVFIEHLKTGETYMFNENRKYLAASLYKLWTMGAVYQKLEDGSLKKNQVMGDNIAKINERFDIASESAELTEGEISMTVDEALNKMITISHNYAALLLSQTIRLSSVRAFMQEYGYTDSSLDPPQTTAADIAKFYKQLYDKEIINENVSQEMMDLLLAQEWNDRIPKYLPKEIRSAHKTGELYGVKHDAGIVFTENGDYIIVLMSETDAPLEAAEVEAKLSKAVYEYFTNN